MSFVCLAYHRIAADPDDLYAVSLEQFEAQMRWLARHRYGGVTASEGLAGNPARIVALTFDDGYADFWETAWPVLQAHNFQATVFAVTGRIGAAADWPGARGVPLMNAAQLATLAAAGVEIGVHGRLHDRMPELAEEKLSADLRRACQDILAITCRSPRALAYPYGVSNPAVERIAAEGFTSGWMARGGWNTPRTPRFRLRRTLVRGRDSLLRFALKVESSYAGFSEWKMDIRGVP
jgi:peptidoglycan/xylan/chitin deacetylase (PgdA/CDA1 family)